MSSLPDTDALILAAGATDATGVRALIAAGADTEVPAALSGNTALGLACEADAVDAVRELLAAGADPNARYTWRSRMSPARCVDRVALHVTGRVDVIHMLHAAGAELDAADATGWTALAHAVSHGDLALVDCLLSLGASRALAGPLAKKHGTLEALCASELVFLRGLEAVPNPKLAARIAAQEQVQARLAQP